MRSLRATLTLFYQQLTSRWRGILAWLIIWSLMSLLFVSVFNDLSKTASQTIKLYQALPKAVLDAFNISSDYLTKPEKFLSGQFLTVYLLAGSIFSLFSGVNAIGGKIEDTTIAQLVTKRIPRSGLYLSQAITNLCATALMSALVGGSMYAIFVLLGNQATLSQRYFVSAFIGSAVLFVAISFVGQMVGIVLSKAHTQALGCGLIVASFFLNGLGSLAGVPNWVQKTSVFYYFNTVQLRDSFSLDGHRLAVLGVLAFVSLVVGALLFRRKDLYL